MFKKKDAAVGIYTIGEYDKRDTNRNLKHPGSIDSIDSIVLSKNEQAWCVLRHMTVT